MTWSTGIYFVSFIPIWIEKGDTYEPDHRNSFWGAKNYARLAAIKKHVDPGNALQVWHGVGFEESSSIWHCYRA
jgi:hypothetical protein